MIQRYRHLGPVILRLALGAVFIAHGLPKLTAPGGFVGFFNGIGIPAPSLMVLVVGAVEAIGGLLLLAGFGVRVAAALLAADMLGAILLAKRSMGFVNGWEFDLILLAASLSLVLTGPLGERTRLGANSNATAAE